MAHTESELQALRVVDLKDLCTAQSLPTTGRKDELVARLLEAQPGATDAEAAPAAGAVEESIDYDEPEADVPAPTDESAAQAPEPASTTAADETPATADGPVDAAAAADAKAQAEAEEIEKQKKRAAKFGVPYVPKARPEPPKPRTGVKPPAELAQKKAAPTPKPAAAPAPAPTPKPVDPIEEEKKRKRAERFGPVAGTDEKKQKV